MESENPVVIFTTWDYIEAVQLQSILNGSDIPCEVLGKQHSSMTLMGGGPALAIRIIVPPSRAEDAKTLLEDFLKNLPKEPGEFKEPETQHCPNCDAELPETPQECPDCGFKLLPMPSGVSLILKEHSPDAAAFCSLCGTPSTVPKGLCGSCRGELVAPEKGDSLCGNRAHVVERKPLRKGQLVCIACKSIWMAGRRG